VHDDQKAANFAICLPFLVEKRDFFSAAMLTLCECQGNVTYDQVKLDK